MVEDISGNSRNDSHQLGVVQLSLGSKGIPDKAGLRRNETMQRYAGEHEGKS